MINGKKSFLQRYVPITDWIRDYRLSHLKKDARAGLTVGVILIPQSMAYALLAGLPPTYGLYASVVPLMIYAMFGTSRQLSIGPVAIISILIATGVGGIAEQGTELYITIVLAVAFFVGATQFLMGLTRLGFLMNFLSNPVLTGFTAAAAFIIGFSQAGNLLGIDLAESKYVLMVIWEIYQHITQVHFPTLLIGVGCIVFILTTQKYFPKWPAHLIAVALATLSVWMFGLDQMGIEIVGSVSSGYPAPSIPALIDIPYWNILPTILAVAFLGFTQSIALAKAMSDPSADHKVDSNQELFSLGLSNMIGSIFHAYPVAGSFSRTAVNNENDVKTPIALIVSAVLVLITLFFFTSLIYYLPNAALAAIIITAVPGLIEWSEVRFLLGVRKREFALLMITFTATLLLGILEGIGIGVLISLIIVIHRSTYPNIVMLGRVPEKDTYRDLNRYPEAKTQTNTIIVRIDAALYFANIPYLKEQLERLEVESGKNLKQIIIDSIGINEVDASALRGIRELVDSYSERNITVIFAGLKGPVRDIFERSGLDDFIGPEKFYVNIHEAVESLTEEQEEDSHLVD